MLSPPEYAQLSVKDVSGVLGKYCLCFRTGLRVRRFGQIDLPPCALSESIFSVRLDYYVCGLANRRARQLPRVPNEALNPLTVCRRGNEKCRGASDDRIVVGNRREAKGRWVKSIA